MKREEAKQLLKKIEKSCAKQFSQIDDIALYNEEKILNAFREERVSLSNFNPSSGYGYDDIARPKLSAIYARIFGAESAFVSPNITCGTHALYLALVGALKAGDTMLSITGAPYDTLCDCISSNECGSLKSLGIKFEQIKMQGSKINLEKALKEISQKKPKMVYIQRSRGYTGRNTLTIEYLAAVIKEVKAACQNTIVMVDNCYGEFCETKEPTQVGADLMAGSLIKNIGGGLAPTGGYIAGRKGLVENAAKRLTAPSLGSEVGSYNATYTPFYEGLFISPHVVGGALKGNIILGKVAKKCGFNTSPSASMVPADIIRTITFNNEEKFVKFVQNIQKLSPVDSFVRPEPYDMPGYQDKVIMAAGTFVQGSSIELSCDGPLKKPYIAYIQGGLTLEHIKLVALDMLENNL